MNLSALVDRRTLLKAAIGGVAASALPAPWARASTAARPWTVPALQRWAPAAGVFRLSADPRVVVRAPALAAVGRTLAEDLGRLTGRNPSIVSGARTRTPGDIHLDITTSDRQLGDEGYRLAIGRNVEISAYGAAGAHYGSRTLLQLLRRGPTIAAGVARDWPAYGERGLMVDIGRKHFDTQWLAARIREMSDLKLNVLHLHFTENIGWRIACESHPEVVSEEHLTKRRVRYLIELAARHHITVIPEIDMPGHMGAALKRHPELQLRDPLGRANANNLDYTLPAARRFAFELVEEYLDLFPGPYWHTGADEYLMTAPPVATPADYATYPQLAAYAQREHGPNATAKDGILGFVNDVARRVRARGKTLRVWNDGLGGGRTVRLDRDAVVEWWTDLDGPSPHALVDAGHRVVNAGYFPTYYINGFPGGFVPGWPNTMPVPPKASARDQYETWEVHQFSGPLFFDGRVRPAPQVLRSREPLLLGAKEHIWNDDPDAATPAQIARGVAAHLRVMAQKTWGSPLLTPSFDRFSRT